MVTFRDNRREECVQMPRKMDTSRLLNGRLGVRKSRKSVNIHTKSGVIWGIPGKANLSMGVAADRDFDGSSGEKHA